jgi:hypothetical protein
LFHRNRQEKSISGFVCSPFISLVCCDWKKLMPYRKYFLTLFPYNQPRYFSLMILRSFTIKILFITEANLLLTPISYAIFHVLSSCRSRPNSKCNLIEDCANKRSL